MIIPLSTITPMASTMPVKDMMLDEIPNAFNKIKLVAMVVKTRVQVAEVVRTTTATTKVATEVLELSSYDT